MKNIFRVFLLFSTLLSIIFSPITNLNAERFSPWAIERLVGKKAPEFTLKDLSGKGISLSSFFIPSSNAQESTPVEYVEYIVKKGDTLWGISASLLKDSFLWPELWKANPQIKNPALIFPGNRIRIPSKEKSRRMSPLPGEDITTKVILLNFWATWCPYCREERPYLNSLYKEYKDKGLVIVAVSTDRSLRKVKAYLKRMPADFIVLYDNNKEAARAYGVYSLPTSFLIDRGGIVRYRFMGLRNWTNSESKKLIEKFLKE